MKLNSNYDIFNAVNGNVKLESGQHRIKSYFYFTGETVDGDIIEFETSKAVTQLYAELLAKKELRELGGGHIDAWFSETDEFAFDVEV